MSKTVINTFTDGMNKDVSKQVMSDKSYLDAQNFRLITTDGGTTGTLETIRGNKYMNVDLQITPEQRIIGSCEIRDIVVLFTVNTSTARCIIFKTFIGLEEEDLFSMDIVYDDLYTVDGSKLYFNEFVPIKAVGRFESYDIQKVYWTDADSTIKCININTTNTITGDVHVDGNNDFLPVDRLEFLPKFVITKPYVVDIVSGKINTGIVAYAYQLYIVNGPSTLFSPLSDSMHVTEDNDFLPNTIEYRGSLTSKDSGKGFKILIQNENVGYNRLRLVRISYPSYGATPIISIVNEIEIDVQGTDIYLTDVGDDIGQLTVDEFTINSTELFGCEDLAIKDDRLFAGSVFYFPSISTEFNITDWDPRAVRCASNGWAQVYDIDPLSPVSFNGDFTTWTDDYPLTHNGINPYNNPNNDGDDPATQYKYQSNGTTLGAEGPNIKIDFVTEVIALDDSMDSTSFSTETLNNGYDTSYKSYASPWKNSKLSWQRDEVYRLSVVFGDDRGRKSDPLWITDLRMPSLNEPNFTDGDGNTHDPGGLAIDVFGVIGTTILYPRVWFKSFPSNATWAQIYRCKRESSDRSIVTQALAIPSFTHGSYVEPMYSTMAIENGGSRLVKLVSPEIMINRNIYKKSNNYLQYVTTFFDDYQSTLLRLNFNTVKLRGNSKFSYLDDNKSDILDASFVIPLSTSGDSPISIGGSNYRNYSVLPIPGLPGAKGSSGLVVKYQNTNWEAQGATLAVVNYKANVFGSQYGGNTYEDRMANTYIPCSDIITLWDINDTYRNIKYGDTFINYFDVSTILADLAAESASATWNESVYVPLESSINCDLRGDKESAHMQQDVSESNYYFLRQEYAGLQELGTHSFNQTKDLYLYNTVYSQQMDVISATSPIQDTQATLQFDCRIKASNVKSNGELSDSWTKFGINEYIDVDTTHGRVTAIKPFNNTLFFWQEKAFGTLAVNDRSLITDDNSSKLVLGTGGVLDRYDYISIHAGCRDKFSITSSNVGIYWFDRLVKSIYRFSNKLENLTIAKYMQSFFSRQNVIRNSHKVIAHANTNDNEVLFTASYYGEVEGFTIAFNELVNAFTSFYSFIPDIYIPFKNRYLTTARTEFTPGGLVDRDCLFLHESLTSPTRCRFYEINPDYSGIVESSLRILFNPEFLKTKVFDNMFFMTNAYLNGAELFQKTFNRVYFEDDYQMTDVIDLVLKTNLERRERGWIMAIPRSVVSANVSDNVALGNSVDNTQLFKERMRDKYLIVNLYYDNNINTQDKFVVFNIGLIYRSSIR